MTGNENGPQVLGTPRDRNALAAGEEAAAIVPHGTDDAKQGDLFPVTPGKPTARPLVLITRGRVEFLAHCPKCSDWHRHVHLGEVTAPCGGTYELQSQRTKGAAA